jgi:hypothetical protein
MLDFRYTFASHQLNITGTLEYVLKREGKKKRKREKRQTLKEE